jgi:hypothetical protein
LGGTGLRGARKMKKDEKIKILSELAAEYPEVRHVVSAIGEEKFLSMGYDVVVKLALPEEYVDKSSAELLADTHPGLCLTAWYDFCPFVDWPAPSKAELGYALIISACCRFEQALEEV